MRMSKFYTLFFQDNSPEHAGDLDFYECRFARAFQTLRIDHVNRELNLQNRDACMPVEREDETDNHSSHDEILTRLSAGIKTPISKHQDRILKNIFYEELRAAIDALPPPERDAVVLCHVFDYKQESENLSEVTASTLCKVSGRTIRARLVRAAEKLSRFNEEN